jgi:hypothetical protein
LDAAAAGAGSDAVTVTCADPNFVGSSIDVAVTFTTAGEGTLAGAV